MRVAATDDGDFFAGNGGGLQGGQGEQGGAVAGGVAGRIVIVRNLVPIRHRIAA